MVMAGPYFSGDIDYGRFIQAGFAFNMVEGSLLFVVNRIDDVRIFAGCLTGRKDWPLVPTEKIKGQRLEAALSHLELELESFEDDELRPRFYLKPVLEKSHSAFSCY